METMIELTRSALGHARKMGLMPRIAALRLGEWVAKGDVLELSSDARSDEFIVRGRRVWINPEGGQALIFLLDYPAHPALR
ncbi:hypothetical protein [Rhodoligotrophos defluvii]|uniref:hypothetical protein n=1 Tax=Rhodoligotrophos defluvii TaxID=2561934 RepID=UPI0010CA00C0|nr:hypothetical protein [Rhodoligotrophos defluvii]